MTRVITVGSGGFTGTSQGFRVTRTGWVVVQSVIAGTAQLQYMAAGGSWTDYVDDEFGGVIELGASVNGVSVLLGMGKYRWNIDSAIDTNYIDVSDSTLDVNIAEAAA